MQYTNKKFDRRDNKVPAQMRGEALKLCYLHWLWVTASDEKTREKTFWRSSQEARIYVGMDEDRQHQEWVSPPERARTWRRDGGCVRRRMLKMMLHGKKKRRFMKRVWLQFFGDRKRSGEKKTFDTDCRLRWPLTAAANKRTIYSMLVLSDALSYISKPISQSMFFPKLFVC